jgi:hypothetical protein
VNYGRQVKYHHKNEIDSLIYLSFVDLKGWKRQNTMMDQKLKIDSEDQE